MLLHGSNLHILVRWLKSVKVQLTPSLPNSANYALYYSQSEIITGLIDGRVQLGINLDTGMLYHYSIPDQIATYVDITSQELQHDLDTLCSKRNISPVELNLKPVTQEGIDTFREFATPASRLLEAFKFSLTEPRSQVYLWGHNFDFDLVVYPEENKQVDIGISPGDSNHPRPYVYITPRPFDESKAHGKLLYGKWIFEPWKGIQMEWSELSVLPMSQALDVLFQLFRQCRSMI